LPKGHGFDEVLRSLAEKLQPLGLPGEVGDGRSSIGEDPVDLFLQVAAMQFSRRLLLSLWHNEPNILMCNPGPASSTF
jgi:hypothetical protein